MVRLTGAALGFLAFAITAFLGIQAGNPFETTLDRAVRAMFAFFAFGVCMGWVAHRIIDEHALRMHRELFPDEHADEADHDDEQGEPTLAAGQ